MICNREAASVEATVQRWGDQIHVVGVAWTGSDDEFQGFIDEHGLTFPQISDDDADVYARFQIAAQPAWAIVRPDGNVEQILGAADEAFLDSLIADLVAEG